MAAGFLMESRSSGTIANPAVCKMSPHKDSRILTFKHLGVTGK